jgi:hypothetical protein
VGQNLYPVLEATAADTASLNRRPCSGPRYRHYNQAISLVNRRAPIGRSRLAIMQRRFVLTTGMVCCCATCRAE